MRHMFLLFIIGIAIGNLIAEQRTAPAKVDPVDLLIEKSHGTMRKAGEVSQRADKQVAEGVSKMKESIQALESEKEQLVEQVKVMQDEIVAIKSEPVAQPFNVLAILPDSTGGGE